jgi:hypothetical protein
LKIDYDVCLARIDIIMTFITRLLLLGIALFLAGCATTLPPPKNRENVCAIFNEYPKWYSATKKTEKKWGIPVPVQMAIIYYESSFRGDARPPRRYILGLLPGKHISSAYGYAQALDGTWDDYLAQAGGFFSKRNKFDSATDFIGWYSIQAWKRLGISQNDPYNLYLAYHEGLGGFERKSYLKKPWLMQRASKVALKSQLFGSQLAFYEGTSPQKESLPLLETPDAPFELEPPAEYYVQESGTQLTICEN